MPKHCVAFGCTNHNYMEKNIKFHIFPNKEKNSERWAKWVQAVKRINADGSKWEPKGRYVYLCSEHFVEKRPSCDPLHPDYVPSIFKHVQDDGKFKRKLERYTATKNRAEKRKMETAKITTPVKCKKECTESNYEIDMQVSCDLTANDYSESTSTPHVASITSTPSSIMTQSTSISELTSTPHAASITSTPSSIMTHSTSTSELTSTPHAASIISSTSSLATEIDYLREEKYNLRKQISSLEEKVLFSKYDPKCFYSDNNTAKYFTGLSVGALRSIVKYLTPFMKRPRTNIPPENQILMVLARLRIDLPFEFLAHQTGLSPCCVNITFHKIINLMWRKIGFMVRWPDRDYIRKTLPPAFKQYFPKLTSIIDCFEIFIERPQNLKARAQVYSNYKKHSTVKFLIACSPLGAIQFVSKGWGGRATDIQIVRQSGYINPNFHHPGDQILADRGFTLKDDFAVQCSSELIVPAFTKGKKQLSAQEVETTRKIANVRIYVERVIGLLKNRYKILQGPLPITSIKSMINEVENETPTVDKIVKVCAALVNISKGIVYTEKK